MGPKKLTVFLMYRKTDWAIFSVLENVLVEWKNKAVKAFIWFCLLIFAIFRENNNILESLNI